MCWQQGKHVQKQMWRCEYFYFDFDILKGHKKSSCIILFEQQKTGDTTHMFKNFQNIILRLRIKTFSFYHSQWDWWKSFDKDQTTVLNFFGGGITTLFVFENIHTLQFLHENL